MPLQGLQPLLSSARAYSWAPAVHRKSIGLTGWPTVFPPFLRTWEVSRPLYSFSLIQCWPRICLQGQYSCSSLPTSEMRGTSPSSWPDAVTPVPNSGRLRTHGCCAALPYTPNGWDGAEDRPALTRPCPCAHLRSVTARAHQDRRHSMGSGALAFPAGLLSLHVSAFCGRRSSDRGAR